MGVIRSYFQREYHLEPPLTTKLVRERDLRVPMRDGVVLLANRWAPKESVPDLPVALIRTPYRRGGALAAQSLAVPLAERGYQVLIQSTRGTFGSGGTFDPMRREHEDGLDTLDWVKEQPWFGGSIVLFGGSYQGLAQWAVADSLPPEVKAMIPAVTGSALIAEMVASDGFSLELSFIWSFLIARQELPGAVIRQFTGGKRDRRAMDSLPLAKGDIVRLGHRSEFLQNSLANDFESPFWRPADHRDRVAAVTVPVSSVGGWYDLFLPHQISDFEVLQSAGKPARLTIGPWSHMSLEVYAMAFEEALRFGLAHAKGKPDDGSSRAPVRLFVQGEDRWQDFETWPPAGYEATRLHLHSRGSLDEAMPSESPPTTYHYDPADPTPTVGGNRLADAGRRENTSVEARSDVLTFTTAVLDEDLEVIGEVSAEVWFRSSLAYADIFVRLCDVDSKGHSHNVCDGLTSVGDADQLKQVSVQLWPTAYVFKKGNRIRIQVSSGAFPRYNRNPGTGEPRGTAVTLLAADQSIHHDPAHPSAIVLPVRPRSQR